MSWLLQLAGPSFSLIILPLFDLAFSAGWDESGSFSYGLGMRPWESAWVALLSPSGWLPPPAVLAGYFGWGQGLAFRMDWPLGISGTFNFIFCSGLQAFEHNRADAPLSNMLGVTGCHIGGAYSPPCTGSPRHQFNWCGRSPKTESLNHGYKFRPGRRGPLNKTSWPPPHGGLTFWGRSDLSSTPSFNNSRRGLHSCCPPGRWWASGSRALWAWPASRFKPQRPSTSTNSVLDHQKGRV